MSKDPSKLPFLWTKRASDTRLTRCVWGPSVLNTCAIARELKEETGYCGVVVSTSPILPADPGLTNAAMVLVEIIVDLSLHENQNPCAELEEGEFIEVHLLRASALKYDLEKLAATTNASIDSRLYSYADGLAQGQEWLSPGFFSVALGCVVGSVLTMAGLRLLRSC